MGTICVMDGRDVVERMLEHASTHSDSKDLLKAGVDEILRLRAMLAVVGEPVVEQRTVTTAGSYPLFSTSERFTGSVRCRDEVAGLPSREEVVAAALARICQPNTPATESYVDPNTWPAGDHGHTDCWIIGGLLAEIEWLNEVLSDLPPASTEGGRWG